MNYLQAIRGHVVRNRTLIVVIDDDPTGSQTVRGAPVICTWEASDIRWAMDQPGNIMFVLTNSRSVKRSRAVEMNEEIADRVLAIARAEGRPVRFISRGDSTLRGHFPAEIDILAAVAARHGVEVDAIVLAPAFIEAGRITVDDTHFLVQDGNRRPIAETEFARDATFEFKSSHLPSWIEEKTRQAVRAHDVTTISLSALRSEDGEPVVTSLRRSKGYVVVNAEENADLDRFVAAMITVEDEGRSFICRTGPSFVRARAGLPVPQPVRSDELFPTRAGQRPGLCIVGSHTALTSSQIDRALNRHDLATVHLDATALLNISTREQEIRRVSEAADAMRASRDVVIYTTRTTVRGEDRSSSLKIARQISNALVDVVKGLDLRRRPPGYILAKGGLTSHDIAVCALGIRRAVVTGQLFAGQVPVWRLEGEPSLHGMPYVIFPGNVGDSDALADALDLLIAPQETRPFPST